MERKSPANVETEGPRKMGMQIYSYIVPTKVYMNTFMKTPEVKLNSKGDLIAEAT